MHILCRSRYFSRAELAKLRTLWGFRIEYDKIRDSYSTALSYVMKYVIKSLKDKEFVALLRALKHRQYVYSRKLLTPLNKLNTSEEKFEYIHTLNVDELESLIESGKLIAVKKQSQSSVPPLQKYYIGEHKDWILFHQDND